jgi:hypothetical protein
MNELETWAPAYVAIADELRGQGYPYAMAKDVADVHAMLQDGEQFSAAFDRVVAERIRERPEFTDAAED